MKMRMDDALSMQVFVGCDVSVTDRAVSETKIRAVRSGPWPVLKQPTLKRLAITNI